MPACNARREIAYLELDQHASVELEYRLDVVGQDRVVVDMRLQQRRLDVGLGCRCGRDVV
jgi:hypothetical protein